MAKRAKTIHVCTHCDYHSVKWLGRCPECGSWGSLVEHIEEQPSTAASAVVGGAHSTLTRSSTIAPVTSATPISRIDPADSHAVPTGISELDRVLGTGIVPGSVVLLAGEPGVGKSTLLLEVAARWTALPEKSSSHSSSTRRALYITAEESAGQVRVRAERTHALHDSLYLSAESDMDTLFAHVSEVHPSLLIVDSVQTMSVQGIDGVAGGVAQSRAVTAALTALAKSTNIPVLLVGHVTKEGTIAGPRVVEHLVDVVLHFEGDRHSSLRMLRGIKNRFGATDEVGCFEQTAEGIREVPDPTGLFLAHRENTPDGTAVTVAMDGMRPLLAEVQSLVVPSVAKNPKRAVTGLDPTRVPMILAVLMARAGMNTTEREVYTATVGGMKVTEPAADLAIALATASALRCQALPERTIVLGEVGLAGEIRRVAKIERRIAEAARLGYTYAIVPAGPTYTAPHGMRIIPVKNMVEALHASGIQPLH